MSTFRLKVLSGAAAGTEYPLGAAEMSLGRSPDNYICIQDSNASRVHCIIRMIGGKAVLRDNKSRNGVYVNNQRVQEHTLQPGDKIGIGSTILEFGAAQAQAAAQQRNPRQQQRPAAQPVGRQPRQPRQPRQRTGTGQPGSRVVSPQKNTGSGSNRGLLYGLVALVVIGTAGALAYKRYANGGIATPTPVARDTLEPLPTIHSSDSDFTKKQMQARMYVDHGDSKRISNDIVGAYQLYAKAVKVDETCSVCQARLRDAKRIIIDTVTEYERRAEIAYDNQRYQEAAERWTAAVELLGNFDKERADILKKRIEDAEREARAFEP